LRDCLPRFRAKSYRCAEIRYQPGYLYYHHDDERFESGDYHCLDGAQR